MTLHTEGCIVEYSKCNCSPDDNADLATCKLGGSTQFQYKLT